MGELLAKLVEDAKKESAAIPTMDLTQEDGKTEPRVQCWADQEAFEDVDAHLFEGDTFGPVASASAQRSEPYVAITPEQMQAHMADPMWRDFVENYADGDLDDSSVALHRQFGEFRKAKLQG